jgi:hypothetical protein
VGIKGEPWAACPLKQSIRVELWEPFIRSLTGGRPLQKYLTLYSPSLMDTKHFTDAGLIGFDDQKKMYKGVVGVAYDDTAFAKAIKLGLGRPEVFLRGNINEILTQLQSRSRNQLTEQFPFEAINLDYEDSVFSNSKAFPVPKHIEALDNLFGMQRKKACQKFCLFFTTRAEPGQLPNKVASDLQQIIDENLLISAPFGQAFNKTYGVNNAADLLGSSYDDFTTLGVIKLVVSMLSERDYEATNCSAWWLNRDRSGGARLLHAAFIVEKSDLGDLPRARILRQYGRRKLGYHARHMLPYLNSRRTNGLTVLEESKHQAALQAKYGDDIVRLLSKTYQLEVPGHNGK